MALILKMIWDNRKALLYVLLAIALSAMLWRVGVWRDAYTRIGIVEAQLELEQECGEGSECQKRQAALEAAQREQTAKVIGSYEQELADLRGRKPVSVRVCNGSGVPNAPNSGTARGAPAAAGLLPGSPTGDRDIGPALSDLAREADEVSARCRALQDWNKALAAD